MMSFITMEAYASFCQRAEEKVPRERPGHMWEDSFKTDIKETGRVDVDWSHLAQDRIHWRALLKTEMNVWVA